MDRPLDLLLVGIGGYGQYHVKELLDKRDDSKFIIRGIIDPKPEGSQYFPQLKEMGIPLYASMEEFFNNNRADLTIITTPINLHKDQACYALSRGSHVLCEKPVSATVQDALEMIDAKYIYRKILAIGFQWSFSDAVQDLKRDIMDGKFGKPKVLKSMTLWPRDKVYFSRPWAAKLKTETGMLILDSVANNAAAHFLHNMLYILGDAVDRSARPASVTAELYRANDIENFDTVFARVYTVDGAELLFIATHASKENLGPVFHYEFENGILQYSNNDKLGIRAELRDGTTKNYGNPYEFSEKKIWTTMEAIINNTSVPCGPEAAMNQVIVVNGMQESMPEIKNFPGELIRKRSDVDGVYVEGLDDVVKKCFETGKLPSELNVPWAESGKTIELTNYIRFPSTSAKEFN